MNLSAELSTLLRSEKRNRRRYSLPSGGGSSKTKQSKARQGKGKEMVPVASALQTDSEKVQIDQLNVDDWQTLWPRRVSLSEPMLPSNKKVRIAWKEALDERCFCMCLEDVNNGKQRRMGGGEAQFKVFRADDDAVVAGSEFEQNPVIPTMIFDLNAAPLSPFVHSKRARNAANLKRSKKRVNSEHNLRGEPSSDSSSSALVAAAAAAAASRQRQADANDDDLSNSSSASTERKRDAAVRVADEPRAKRQRGAANGARKCENCRVAYDDYEEHRRSAAHQRFVSNASNYKDLDHFIAYLNAVGFNSPQTPDKHA
jgi:DBF zinc finger